MIKRSTHKPVTSSTSITSGIQREAQRRPVSASRVNLTPEQRAFERQLRRNVQRSSSIMAATNTSNIMARPDFLELLPMFVQKLLITDVYGSVAMRSRQQLIPYFKFIAENTKGQTHAGDILSSPFVNRQGLDSNFTGNVIKNEEVAEGAEVAQPLYLAYRPVLPNSVTVAYTAAGTTQSFFDKGDGKLYDAGSSEVGTVDYATGLVTINGAAGGEGNSVVATYRYDNETVGPHTADNLAHGQYGAAMGKGYLQLDEFNLVAEAHQLACYWSIYSAFAAQQEYGSNLGDIAKEAAFSEITAEINAKGFEKLEQAAKVNPAYNWNAAPVHNGSVVPTDYMNTFKLKLQQAANGIYQSTNLTRPNRLVVGTNVASYISMINGFNADTTEDTVGPYHLGSLDQFEIYVDPYYNPDKWVMACKSNDIRRNSALFGEYMPLTSTDPIGLANASVQQGYATMYGMKVVNPATVVSGMIVGTF